MTNTPEWQPFPWFLLRATGMPFAWLADAGDAPVWNLDDLVQATSRARAQLADALRYPDIAAALAMSNPALGPKLLDSWRASLAGSRRRSKERARERTIWRYLQRFCAKNDTTSFFGATSLGRFDQTGPTQLTLPIAHTRRAFLEHWAAQALADAAITDFDEATPAGWNHHPRRAPNIRVDGHTVTRAAADRAVARWRGPTYAHATRLADGSRATHTLAQAVAQATGCDPSSATDAIQRLLAEGALVPAAHLAIGTVTPLADVRAAVARQPHSPTRDTWLDDLDALRRELDAFADAPLATRRDRFTTLEAAFEDRTHDDARRHPGEFYAARTILHEVGDRSGAPIALGPQASRAVTDALDPLFELCALHTLADRLTFRAWYDTAIGLDTQPFDVVANAYRAAGVRVHLATPPDARALTADLTAVRDDLRAQVDAHLATHGPDHPLTLDLAAFEPVRTRWHQLAQDHGVAYANPDLLVGDLRPSGGPLQVVLGDIHAMPYLTPALYAAAPDRDTVFDHTRRWLADLCAPALPALPALDRRSFMAFEPDLGQVALEVDGRAPVPFERRAALGDLQLTRTDDGFRLTIDTYDGTHREIMPLVRAANVMSRLSRMFQLTARVHPVRLLALDQWLAATTWRTADALPRLLWGQPDPALELVVTRRRFRVPSHTWATIQDPAEALRRLGEITGRAMPRFCFAKAPSEPKPLLVDWANPVAAEMALWLARREPELTFVEMVPGPDALWLRGPDGGHTSELRVVFARAKTWRQLP